MNSKSHGWVRLTDVCEFTSEKQLADITVWVVYRGKQSQTEFPLDFLQKAFEAEQAKLHTFDLMNAGHLGQKG